MHGLDLNLLEALDALLQEGSVARAAARLHLSAPAMSRTLGRIREATHDPILVRAGRGLVPTPHAIALRERVGRALAEARAVLGPESAQAPDQFRRTFVLRVDDAVTAVIGPGLLSHLRQHAPGITLVFRAEGDEDVSALRDGSVDLDIGVQGSLGPEVRAQKLFDDPLVVLLRRGGPRKARALSLAQYAARPHVDVSRRGLTRGPVDELLAQQGLKRRVVAVVPNQLAAATLVAQCDAVSLVSRCFAQSIERLLPVSSVALAAALPLASVALSWHPRFDADPVHRWLRGELRQLACAPIS